MGDIGMLLAPMSAHHVVQNPMTAYHGIRERITPHMKQYFPESSDKFIEKTGRCKWDKTAELNKLEPGNSSNLASLIVVTINGLTN
ncbi:hypothetical protein OsJ_31477 [Oryza sativa Japonica Group]|uniref:Uncharacterized protein n=1 Tax=Oryza sativa subsp. japonica TaxID=39947 RepID=A3C4M2_ORYSJ|nr:hypothetical protein OsJ_31477 [Oryza sativa Japonica Group]